MHRAVLMENIWKRNSNTDTPFCIPERCHHSLPVCHLCKDNSSGVLTDICKQH